MATTLSDLRTRLQYRLGIDTASTLEQNRIDEALNAAIAKVASDGISGATLAFSALARGTKSLTVDSHTANTATITVTDTLTGEGIFPGDWLTIDSSGVKLLIYSVDEATKTLHVGSPYDTAISGTLTVQRRSIQLPSDGPVTLVRDEAANALLEPSTLSIGRWGFDTGTADFFAQRWSEEQGVSYLAFSPAPSDGDVFVIEQSKFRSRLSSSTEFNFAEPVLNSILEEARKIHLGWSGDVSPTEAASAERQARDFKDQYKNSAGSDAPLRKR